MLSRKGRMMPTPIKAKPTRRRYRPRALAEIRRYQKSTKTLIPKVCSTAAPSAAADTAEDSERSSVACVRTRVT
jgi:hypothetical protein